MSEKRSMWIMVAGPYATGAPTPEARAANLRVLNEAALAVLRAGHLPLIGVNLALPVIAAAGDTQEAYDEIMMPLSLALADRCDAILRIGGPSHGADAEAERFRATGRPVFTALDQLPLP